LSLVADAVRGVDAIRGGPDTSDALFANATSQRYRRPTQADARTSAGSDLTCMCAVRMTRFGGPGVIDIVDISEPQAGPEQ
jgi:hypothetical protein